VAKSEPTSLLCPSAQPGMADAMIFGVVGGTADRPQVRYLTQPQPVTPELLEMAAPVKPTEVFRIAAVCAGSACPHHKDSSCQLVRRVIALLPSEVASLPPCRVRPSCLWWQQEGRSACMRCPGIVTDGVTRDGRLMEVAGMTSANHSSSVGE